MAQQLITVGNIAGDGTGDQLRDAFTKINENFAELYSGNIQVTAANIQVYTVAGRTGNIALTVNDVAQAAAKSYVNTAIASNVAILNNAISSINADIGYVMGNAQNWTSNVTTVSAALDQLAERIKNLGG